MNPKFVHNSRESNKKTLFKAPKWNLQRFLSVPAVTITFSFSLLILINIFYSSAIEVESKKDLKIPFGLEQTVNVFPSRTSTDDWSFKNNALTHDLGESALYQEFNTENATFIPDSLYVEPEVIESPVVEGMSEEAIDGQVQTTSEEAPVAEPPTPSAEPILESIPEPDVVPETSGSESEPVSFEFTDEVFPLAQLTLTSTTEPISEEVVEQTPAPEPAVEEQVPDEPIPESVPDTVSEQIASSSEPVIEKPKGPSKEIRLSDFETAPLERGQFVEEMNIRLSFAAKLKTPATGQAPYVEVLYGHDDALVSIGNILIDDEVSNAINGGYYFFTLPESVTLESFATSTVVVRYYGEEDELEGAYLDAAWLEINTRTITKEDLLARGVPEKLDHLDGPVASVLLSDQINFARSEKPIFNLRYESQRNLLVRGFRSLLNRDLVEVASVEVNHNAMGYVGIATDVSVTKDGLVTIEIPDQELTKMRPGSYEITVTYNEGGKDFTDTFDFQWGILSINPLQSEYQVGDTAKIAIGALTPNGHTICQGNLDLYITDPDGFITKVPVIESGQCNGNNVIDVPDFSAEIPVTLSGSYELYLERLDDDGTVIGFTTDTFNAVHGQKYSIARNGPTRIYPVAPYEMELTVEVADSFRGVVTERVPAEFEISSTTADISTDGAWKVLSWDVSIGAGGSRTLSYGFDAPDLSPYLYNLGPASLSEDERLMTVTIASTTASSSEEQVVKEGGGVVFEEHRQWQIASDAVGNMIVYWDNATYIPTGWTCLSCGSGTFYQRFAMGSSTYNTTGGATTHTHTANGSVLAASAGTTESGSGSTAPTAHTHTYTPTIGTASNLPSYRQLRVIQYTAAAGEPPSLPAGAIGIFDASVPTGWTRYSAQDGYYIRGENTPGTTGGANTHTHTITGTTGAANGTAQRTRGGGASTGTASTHTHTVSGNSLSASNEPPYIEVILGKLNSTSTAPNGLITMWTEDVDGGWLDVSTANGDPFNQRFLKASTTYGTTGGSFTNTHSDTSVTSSGASANSGTNQPAGTAGSGAHTHTVNITNFSTSNHLPPYLTVVYGKRQGTNPVFDQKSYRWYTNTNAVTPTDPWPSGGTDLAEANAITASTVPVKKGDIVRLRVNAEVTNATSTAGTAFKLQYAAADTCSAGTWTDVGAATSSAIWRGYNNTSVADGATLSSNLLASSTVSETYEEDGLATTSPNQIPVDDIGEWDFVLEQNGAAAGTNYCFRLILSDGTPFATYTSYPQLFTNEAPEPSVLEAPFDNEKTASTTPYFYFYSTDAESNKIHYQIQIDNNYDFSSPAHDLDTENATEDDYFENQVLISDKAPFIQGDLIRVIPPSGLTNGTTYYWRVRGLDPEGSDEWGEWSTIQSVTIDTSLTASAWFQTEDEQFQTNTLSGVQTGGDQVVLISGSSTGSMISSAIDFDDGSAGTAWGSLVFADTETSGDLKYQIQYYDSNDTWSLIPDAALTGNSTGFDTSPVSLLDLDTNVYNLIRVVANFTNSGGSPSLQSWQINWGYRVETPSISMPFANEQVATTTPTFEFTTTDPQNDSLTYQISWSTLPDFTSSTTRTSGTHSGFTNIDFGADTDPFISGDTIQFKIQPADALTGTTTYWWRVRAKDTTGADAYSFWSEPRSFTVIPGTAVSTWFQTTEEQFETNILSGVRALGSDVMAVATTASEAMLVYGEGTETEPRYRIYDGTDWSTEDVMLDVGAPVRQAVVRAGTTREEYVAATVSSDADVNVQVYATGIWADLQEVTTNVGNISARGFDVAYETLSGDAMVAYCDGDADPSYYIWNGSTWTSGGTINLGSASNCEWLQLASDPVSDEIILLSRDAAGGQYEAQVWSGSAWGNSTIQGSIQDAAHEGMAVMYEESGGQAVIVTSDGNPARFRTNNWNGTTWAGASTVAIGDDLEWAKIVRDEGSDEMLLCYQDEDSASGVMFWTGAAWTGTITELIADGNANNKSEPGFDCVFEDTTGRNNYSLTTMSNTTQTSYFTWNNTSWSAASQVNTIGDTSTMQLIRTGVANVLGVFYDDPSDALLFTSWTGSSWTTTQTIESDASGPGTAPFGQPFFMAPRNDGRDGTSVVSPGIDFDEGTGPYWKTFSWNDTTPGSSEILYYLQYETSPGVWAFIPNSALSGNESGFTTSPIDLSALNTNTYNVIRPYAEFSCDGSNNCPTLSDWKIEWAGGINISGTIDQYNQTTDVTSGTVAVAVNGVLQTGKTGTIAGGTWTIANVTAFEGDIITVFVTSAASSNEAVGVTRYDGQGDVTGMTLFERHLTLGSNDATTTPMTNADIGLYDFTNSEDLFFNVTGTTLVMCADTGCFDAELYIKAGTYYTPGGRFVTHDFENNGIFTAGSFTHEINGSWDNNATTTMTGSTITFAATSTTETIDNTGAPSIAFNNVTLGTTTGNGTWNLGSTLDVNGNLTVTRGTFARATTPITIAGNLSTEANGFWTGVGTTTFDGNAAATWRDLNATLQNVGNVVVDGTSKIVTLAGNVAAQSITIGANDTLDASVSNYDITVYGNWNNQNNFVARSGEVFFAATASGRTITTTGDAFYDLTFSGSGGGWAFSEATLQVNNDLRVQNGTVTFTTGTTTVGGSFITTGGTWQHNNGTMLFTSGSAENITFLGTAFTNVAHNITFNGAGSWTITDTNATSTNDVRVIQGTINFPSGVFAIGGSLIDAGGAFAGGTGTARFYSAAGETITFGGSSLNNAVFAGAGSWTISDTNATILGDLTVSQGMLTLPGGTLSLGGSYDNNATVTPGTGTLLFNSADGGETIAFGSSSLYNVWFNNAGGGWTITENATTTNNFSITSAGTLTLDSGRVLSVGATFTNNAAAATTWTGSTLALRTGNYSINTKTDAGDTYATLVIDAPADIRMWNSSATTYSVNASGSLYSQDHNAVDGDLYIWGAYGRSSGTEYWSYATDFDGTALGGSPRQVDVRFASGASATFTGSTVNITGISTASTTIANQGSGTYTVSTTGGTFTAEYYEFADLGGAGVSLLGGVSVPTLGNGAYTVAAAAGSGLTLSSTTIDANPSKQIYNVRFATTTAIAANNVSQTDGTPASFWWFREGTGNLYGEAKDNDTGNPGSVRFDDSSLVLTISGTVYSDGGVTPLTGGTCDGSTPVVRVVVQGGTSYTGSCSNVDGSYSIGGVIVTGDPTLTIYLDNASGGQRGSVITRTPTADITDADIYANRVIVRHEDATPLSIANLAVYDFDNDSDLRFTAATTSGSVLNVMAGNELYVFATSTFTPGGTVTLAGNAAANGYDGTLYLANGATFNAYASSTLTVGGRFVLESAATFNPASTTVLMNATTSGKSITSPSEITFNELVFNGVGGTWNLGADIEVLGDMTITNGTVTGTGDISLPDGSLTGNGVLSLGAGTTTIARTNTLGGTTAWTFYNLQLGSGLAVGTTTPVFTSTTTIAGRLTIAAAHFLDAGATNWDLSGAGTVFVETGTFLEDTSTIRYSGAGATVLSTTYYNLDINAGAGTQTYTPTGTGVVVQNSLTIGGTSGSVFDVNASDPAIDINGTVTIRSNGTFTASNSGTLTIGGSYTNDGTFNGGNGTTTFDGTGTTNIAAGSSSFSNVRINGSGSFNVTEHATSTGNWRLLAAGSFTVSSGQSLAVGGAFFNAIGSVTTWTGTTLRLSGGGNYSVNTSTTSDSYGVLDIDGTTQVRMWNSDASSYVVDSTASLYSQDHANVAGDLYIYGSYRKTTGSDFWAYAYDFDGTVLGGGARKVDVFFASGANALFTGGSLFVQGASNASTTLQNQGSGTYGITIGGNASTSWQYYEVTDTNSSGLVFTGAPTVATLSYGSFEVSQNGGSGMTVGGTVINQNPAKNFTQNRFFLNGVGSGVNVTATGTSVSAWRFANHYGDIDGEGFDVDPNGDPGYVAWDDSAALITVSGTVYSDEGSTISTVCDGVTNNIVLRVAGITSYSTSCNAATGLYSISNVAYGSTDSLVVYIDGETEKAAAVSQEPLSNINDLSLYENRVIVRHEGVNPLTIDDMAVWDSSDDADIPFTALSGSPDTLTLPANRKLIVWSGKNFAPGGNVTLAGAGAGAAYDGTLELYSNADWTGAGTESLSVGGSLILNANADFLTSNGTTTFTTTGASRTIDLNQDALHHVAFTGSGSWTITDPTFTANGNVSQTNGTLDLPTATSTFNGSFVNNGGTFDANGGIAYFNGGGTHSLRMGGSALATIIFSGGIYTMTDTNATSTASVTIESGTVSLPAGSYAVGGDFENTGGTITHNNSRLALTNATAATLLASSSDLFAVDFRGGGTFTMADDGITFLDDFIISGGSSVQLASGTIAVGGSMTATGGTFTNATTTFLFNSADGGETINPGVSEFYAVQVSAPTGGYTLTGSATTTHNFTLATTSSFATQSGVVLRVEGVFTNTANGNNTNWNGSTLVLDGANAYTINTKLSGGDRYNTLIVGANSDIRTWNSSATTTTVAATASLYSQDHNAGNGILNIYGDFHIGTTTEYWSYARDFDGTLLTGGNEREVTVLIAQNATTTVDGGSLQIIGVSGNETTITNQGSGTYAFAVSAGTFNAQYYAFRNLNTDGLNLSGTPTITSLSYGDYELAVNGGTLITLASSTLNANASKVITGNRFATTTAITGNNVTLVGVTSNAWTYTSHTGNLDGEAFDDDGVSECGSVRWNDSACLITQQTHYRWRNDDGGVGVPSSEWYDADWDARKSVRIENTDATAYTDAVVQMFVDYDSDMQADFEDLRFTEDDGTTLIPHWIGSSTDSTRAEVWVRVPSLAAESVSTVYMYYNNPTATSSSSADDTFIAADDFEDDDIAEYSGQTGLFNVGTALAYDGTYGLDNAGQTTSRANLGGIYRLDQTVSQGETFRYTQYVNTAGTGDEACTKFGIQSPGTANDNYAVCIELSGTDRIALVKDSVENDSNGGATTLDSTPITFTTGWYEFEVEWGTDDTINVSMYNAGGTLIDTLSATDGTYTSGGIGFTFWFNLGGWDSVSSRPTLTTEPTVYFGGEQTDGGATWKDGQNTPGVYDVNDIARLRVAIENSGLAISNQQMLLEYAALGAAPSCEAVNPASYVAVPVQASCGTSPVCMQSSTLVTNGASIADLLTGTIGTFTTGQLREDPSNITTNINIGQNEFTEIEYVITPTSNTVDQNLCFRVTNNGTDFDTYLSVAQLTLRFDPSLDTFFLNGGPDIALLPGTTTRVYATTTVTDLNGPGDLLQATSTIYRSGATPSCTPDNNNCYISQCSFTNCSGNSCTVMCYADIYFHAEPTDTDSPYEGEEWTAFIEVQDYSAGYDMESPPVGVELLTLPAITVNNAINYGALEVGQDTGSSPASTTVENLGNLEINLEIEGTDMTDGYSSVIPVTEQKFATSTFNYGSCLISVCNFLSTTPFEFDVELLKPTTHVTPVADDIYWGIEVPPLTNSTPHSGINVFTPVSASP